MPDTNKIHTISFRQPELKTLSEYLNEFNTIPYIYSGKESEFLKIQNSAGETNEGNILKSFKKVDEIRKLVTDGIISVDGNNKPNKILKPEICPIKLGTQFYVEYDKVNGISWVTEGIEIVSNDDVAFKASALAKLEGDTGYISASTIAAGMDNKGTSKEIFPDMTVWVWCRALSPKEDETKELTGQFFDLSPFIQKISTNMGKNGGNFQITLPPLVCYIDSDNKWAIRPETLDQYTQDVYQSIQGEGYVAQGSLFDEKENGRLSLNSFYFHNILKANDLVLIRFETLKMEKEKRKQDAAIFSIDKSHIAGRIYDMIGLIDSCKEAINPANTDVMLSIQGRDLSKVFIEDGTYFYALENSKGILRVAGQSQQSSQLLSRVFAEGGMGFIGLYTFTSIEYILKFIFLQLSSIQIVPDDLFSSYGKRRNKKYEDVNFKKLSLSGDNEDEKRAFLKDKSCKYIRLSREENKLTLENPVKEQEYINSIFNKLVDFFKEIKRAGAVKTKDGGFDRWKPITINGESISANEYPESIYNDLLTPQNQNLPLLPANSADAIYEASKYVNAGTKQETKPKIEKKLARGIWQIIKLVIDSSVSNRRLADSSFSTAQGSILNFIRQACMEPLVESYMDTYGDMYHLIVRKPPYDQIGVTSLINGRVNTEETNTVTQPAIVDIEMEDVYVSNFDMDDTQVYSWYHFFPKGALINDRANYALSYLPALYFDEYAKIYGSKAFQQSNSYTAYMPLNDTKNDEMLMQSFYDLKYVVESNQYLPFTRKGTIVINMDRRIKIGNVIRYKATGEIFFVDSVNHSFSIGESSLDRRTTLQVSRGMIESLIYGIHLTDGNGSRKMVSYFNLIDTRLDLDTMKDVKLPKTEKVNTGRKRDITVDVDVQDNTEALGNLSNFARIAGLNGLNQPAFVTDYQKLYDKRMGASESKFVPVFEQFLNAVNRAGYQVIITSFFRTFAEQAGVASDKRNARAGTSRHEFGRAIDINVIEIGSNNFYRKSDVTIAGKKITNSTLVTAAWEATGIPKLAESFGLRWGGTAFGTYKDNVHFEIAGGKEKKVVGQEDIFEDKTTYVTERRLDYDGVFKNFRVNQFTFNFFLKGLQFKEEYRQVKSRQIFNSDQEGTLSSNVTVTGINKSKKK